MNIYGLLGIVIALATTVLGVIKWQKVKNGGLIGVAFISSITKSLSPEDDTPGKLTPAEVAEAFESAGAVGKGILKDI